MSAYVFFRSCSLRVWMWHHGVFWERKENCQKQMSVGVAVFLFISNSNILQTSFLPSKQLYSPGCTLASCTICLQASRFLALSLHLLIPIFLRSVDTSCGHLILGLPLCLVAYSFPYSIFFRIAVSCVLSICPSHRILWHLINLTIYILQTGIYIFSRNLGATWKFWAPEGRDYAILRIRRY